MALSSHSLHCLCFEDLEVVKAFSMPAVMKGRWLFVDEICVFTGFASLQYAGKDLGYWESAEDAKGFVG